MAGLTHKGENLIINDIFRKKEFYVGLLKSDPTDQGNINEVNGIAYKRQRILFIAPELGQTYNETDIEFPTAKQNWGFITHIGLFDKPTGGELIAYSELDYAKEIRSAELYKIPKAFFIFKID